MTVHIPAWIVVTLIVLAPFGICALVAWRTEGGGGMLDWSPLYAHEQSLGAFADYSTASARREQE